jgi:glutamyl-Q tRNA(Asp) synthetase
MSSPVLRFAPSPNGNLHLGHALSALLTAEWARRLNGRFLLRIEDIDTARTRPEFVEAIFTDLRWLGLEWEEPVLFQSTRFETYARFADRLRARGLLYPCFCSRSDSAARAEGTDPDGAPLYPGTCRHLDQKDAERRLATGEQANWRLDTRRASERVGALAFTMAEPTPLDRPRIRYARPERWGDVVLVRKDTPTSYHLSVVVDDAEQGITHVTRGRDMEAATDIHTLLQALFALPMPNYTFHRLILDDEGRKLSKSRLSQSLSDLRASGWTPDDVRRALGLLSLSG